MNIASLCRHELVTVEQGTNLREAAQRMRDEHVGALVVTGAAGPRGVPVLGVVTDRDLAIEVLARGQDGSGMNVDSIVSGRLVAVPGRASLSDAIETMEAQGVRRLLVTGQTQELIGVVSIDDLIEAWAEDMARLARSLHKARDREEEATSTAAQDDADAQRVIVPDEAFVAA